MGKEGAMASAKGRGGEKLVLYLASSLSMRKTVRLDRR